jgi:DNA topoisomerase-1
MLEDTVPFPTNASNVLSIPDAKQAAKSARLRYVTDLKPGIRREMESDGTFRYIAHNGSLVTDEETLARIKGLGIPPAYTHVWICPHPNGHLQATGRDAKGRKQYRYHARWKETRDNHKYDRMLQFGDALPKIRTQIEADLVLPGLPKRKVLAAIVRLMEETRIRVGSAEYARQNDSYGLTTLHNEHVEVGDKGQIHFGFRGKSGKTHSIDIRDKRVAKVIKQCQELPEQELFEWVDKTDGTRHDITAGDVNDYLREIGGEEFTAKDFRTWSGTVLAALCLLGIGPCENKTAGKKNVTQAVKQVAARLGNTPAVCRKAYIHPGVIEAYLSGTMQESLAVIPSPDPIANHPPGQLSPEEQAVLDFLRSRS